MNIIPFILQMRLEFTNVSYLQTLAIARSKEVGDLSMIALSVSSALAWQIMLMMQH